MRLSFLVDFFCFGAVLLFFITLRRRSLAQRSDAGSMQHSVTTGPVPAHEKVSQ